MTVGQSLILGLQVALIGMAIVFLGLIILVFLFTLMSRIVRAIQRKPNEVKDPTPAPVSAVAVAAPAPIPAAAQDDEDIAAAIAAAIAVIAGEEGSGLVVRSIRRMGGNASSWNAAGRMDIINTRY